MKATIQVTLILTEAESNALKKLIGNISPNSKFKMGLTVDEADLTSQIYQSLPEFPSSGD